MNLISNSLISLLLLLLPLLVAPTPSVTPWPPQFQSIVVTNSSEGLLQVQDLWYDWANGRNLFVVQPQLGRKLINVEYTNGTSYNYTMGETEECNILHFPTGILGPDLLEGVTYSGQEHKDGFLCNVWEKDIVRYYEDAATSRPVFWTLITGLRVHVMTFEVGKVLEEPYWQAPVYCFESKAKQKGPSY